MLASKARISKRTMGTSSKKMTYHLQFS